MRESRDDEFYVGYLPASPAGIGRHTRAVVLGLLLLAVSIGALLVSGQHRFSGGRFEWGSPRELTGIARERPQPMLLVPRPGGGVSPYLVVAVGKFGGAEQLAGLDGKTVRLTGTLFYRDGQTLIEIQDGSVEPLTQSAEGELPAEQSLGTMTLVGEIVDSKCWSGVMKPGEGKPHRACAVRCISGGIPPMLRVDQPEGPPVSFLLVGADGRVVNDELLDMVAEPVEIRGEVVRQGELLVLRADPDTYRRP